MIYNEARCDRPNDEPPTDRPARRAPDQVCEYIDTDSGKPSKSRVQVRSYFFIRSGYKDEPKVDVEGKPLLHRTIPVHQASGYDYNLHCQ
ncbi:unnamed protein product [Trichogramma brassicae]|uniref:Uncharacterized protein n=1 Tax=Trichogramma brassicae TaxID=86971 RepID=A0A6H5HXF4_9HYME|nr:unnamed protein product [Trichogramma brassicae]